MTRRMWLEHFPGGVLLGCRECPPFRRSLTTAGGVAAEWARHLSDCHGAMREASDFLYHRRTRGDV